MGARSEGMSPPKLAGIIFPMLDFGRNSVPPRTFDVAEATFGRWRQRYRSSKSEPCEATSGRCCLPPPPSGFGPLLSDPPHRHSAELRESAPPHIHKESGCACTGRPYRVRGRAELPTPVARADRNEDSDPESSARRRAMAGDTRRAEAARTQAETTANEWRSRRAPGSVEETNAAADATRVRRKPA